MKQALWPARPLIIPVWSRIRPLVRSDAPETRAPGSRPVRAATKLPPPGTIRALTRSEFRRLEIEHRYYRTRWRYQSAAGAEADRLIARDGLHRALELGPMIRSLIVGADVLDYRERDELESEGRFVLHDARRTPWPVADKAYDLFVALQVFEHLGSSQAAAFAEVRRIARHAILSLPIGWDMGDPGHSHHMLSHEQVLAWFAPIVPTKVIEGNPGPKQRLIYVFEDLPA